MEKVIINSGSYVLIVQPETLDGGKKKARVYCRCSTERQVKGNGSVEVQLEQTSRYAKEKNFEIVAFYIDEAISGLKKTCDRPALEKLNADIQKGEILISASASRLGRNLASTFTFVEELQKKKVGVHLVDIGDITGSQSILFNMMVVLASQEQKQISQRVSAAMQYIKSKGELKTRPRFGEKHTGVKREYEEDPEAKEVIEYIIQRKKDGPISDRALARELNEKYEASKFGKKKWYGVDIKRYYQVWNIATDSVTQG